MRKAGDILNELLREQFGPEFMEAARTSSDLFSSWEQIVSEVLPRDLSTNSDQDNAAAHSRIKDFDRGVLLIEADHPGWIQILQTKQGELLSAFQKRYPKMDIKSLNIKLSRS